MKLRGLVAGFVMLAAHAVLAADVNFEVAVSGAKSDAGKVRVNINADEEQFKGKTPALQTIEGDLKDGAVKLKVASLPEGRYSISVVHDANSNGKLDSNAFGMPTEAFGFSNNPKIRFGPPSFEQTVIEVKDGQVIDIKLVTLSFGR